MTITIESTIVIILIWALVLFYVYSFTKFKDKLTETIRQWQRNIKTQLTYLDATELLESKLEEATHVRIIRSLTTILPVCGVLLTAIFAFLNLDLSNNQIQESDIFPIFYGVAFGALGAIFNQCVVTLWIERVLLSVRNNAAIRFQGHSFREIIITPSSHIDSVRSSVESASKDLQDAAQELEKRITKSAEIYKKITNSARELCSEIGKVSASFKEVNIKGNIENLNKQVGEFAGVVNASGKAVQSQTDKSNNVYKELLPDLKESVSIAKSNIASAKKQQEFFKKQQEFFGESMDVVHEERTELKGAMLELKTSTDSMNLEELKQSMDGLTRVLDLMVLNQDEEASKPRTRLKIRRLDEILS